MTMNIASKNNFALIISFCLFLDDLVAGIAKTKALLLEKANPNSRRSQQEITDELDLIVRKATSKYIYVWIISKEHQMTNLVSNFEYLVLLSFLTLDNFLNLGHLQGIVRVPYSKEIILSELDFFQIWF